MGVQLAREAHEKLALTRRWIVCRGVFRDIKFLHVSEAGNDDFEVDFSNGAVEWEIKPLNSNQVAKQTALRFFYPQPVTNQFEEVLNSLERGQPNYAELTPELASTLRARWPTLQEAFKNWRGRDSISFLRHEDDGSDDFRVVYGDHPMVWNVGPLDGTGKISGLKYDESPD